MQWISYASFSALLWVPETPRTSRDLLILVEQSTEAVAPSEGVRLARRRLGEWSEGSGLAEGPVWPVAVVVVLVLVEHGGGVPRVDDQDAVEELAPDAPDEAFGDGVGPRRPDRCLDDADVDGGEDGVERGGEFGVAVPDEKPKTRSGVVEVHAEVAGLLGRSGAGRVGGDTQDVHAAGGVLDDEERVQPVQGDGVEMEQVAGQDRARLRPQKLGPGRSGSAG
jgi:hypothetical protein